MPEIVIPRQSITLNNLCNPSPTLSEFAAMRQQQFGCQSVSRNVAYCLAPNPAPQAHSITTMINNLPERSRHKLGCCIDQHGENTVRLARFMEWVRTQTEPDTADLVGHGNGLAGAGATILGARSNSFMAALEQYQHALIKLNEHSRVGRGPAAIKAQLRLKVRAAYDKLNRYFQQELQRFARAPDFGRNKGTAITGADRGITLAERHKGRGIRIADVHEGRAVTRFSQSLSYAGKGIIAVDLGLRTNKVYQSYQDDGEWEREIAVQTGGLTLATGAGYATGRIVALTMARIALAATPWGWALIIGSSVIVGAYAAYQADGKGQKYTGQVYDSLLGN